MRAIDGLRCLGYRVELEGENIVCRFIGIGEPDFVLAIPLLQELQASKAEAVAQLRREAAEGWPLESFEAEARFGHRAARLYPFLGRRVLTSHGPGILRQVIEARCVVSVSDDPQRVVDVPADLVRPMYMASEDLEGVRDSLPVGDALLVGKRASEPPHGDVDTDPPEEEVVEAYKALPKEVRRLLASGDRRRQAAGAVRAIKAGMSQAALAAVLRVAGRTPEDAKALVEWAVRKGESHG